MSVIFCHKCHKAVTNVVKTDKGVRIGNITFGKGNTIQGGIAFKCPDGHRVIIKDGISGN